MMLSDSGGQLAEVAVVCAKSEQDSQFIAEIKKVYEAKIWGLPSPSEASYKVLLTDEHFFKGYFKEHHQVVILATKDNLSKFQNVYEPSLFEKIKNFEVSDSSVGFLVKDVWAKNQHVFVVVANSKNELETKLKKHPSTLLQQLKNSEQQTGLKRIFDNKDTATNLLLKLYKYGVLIPKSYKLSVQKKEFNWLRKSAKKYDYGIFMSEEPYLSQDQFSEASIIDRRNKLTKANVPGELPNTYMGIEPVIKPVFREVNLNGFYAIEMRGWWNLVGDFMGGPFVSYTIFDQENKRIITLEGNVYGPNEAKKKPLREIELILSTFKIL